MLFIKDNKVRANIKLELYNNKIGQFVSSDMEIWKSFK